MKNLSNIPTICLSFQKTLLYITILYNLSNNILQDTFTWVWL